MRTEAFDCGIRLSEYGRLSVLVVKSLRFMQKHFRHKDTKKNINQRFHFVSWCLCGNSFPDKSGFPFHSNRLVRVRDLGITMNLIF